MKKALYSYLNKMLGVICLVASIVLAINLLQGEPASVIVWLTHQALHIELDLHGFFDKMLTALLITITSYCAFRTLFYKGNYAQT